jgi:hypothetical protein
LLPGSCERIARKRARQARLPHLLRCRTCCGGAGGAACVAEFFHGFLARELYLPSTTKWLTLYPIAAPMKRSEGKCAWVGSRDSERTAAAP